MPPTLASLAQTLLANSIIPLPLGVLVCGSLKEPEFTRLGSQSV